MRRHIFILIAAVACGAGVALLPRPSEPAFQIEMTEREAPSIGTESESFVIPKITAPPVVARHTAERGTHFPEAPAFVETGEGLYEAKAAGYRAELSASGLTYRSLREGLAEGPHEIRLALSRVARGEETLFERADEPDADAEIAVPGDEGGLSFWRSQGFEEHYLPRGDGIEQSFILESAPAGSGDLELVSELSLSGLTPLPPRATRNGGISFVDKRGNFAARYGQIVVRDSARRGVVLEPKLSADGRAISFAVPGQWLAEAQYPVVIDPLVGSDFLLSSDNAVGVGPPTVIAGGNSFLVVWNDFADGPTVPQLFASIVSQSGISSIEFPISSAVGIPGNFRFQRIEGAFDGDNWLVVWSDNRTIGAGVRGSIVSSVGAVLGGNDFLISATTRTVIEDPLAAFNGVDFVVAWQDLPPGASGGSQVHYARVTSAGVVDIPAVVPAENLPVSQALLFLAPQKPSGDTLLLYRENNDIPDQTRSVRIAIDGLLRDPGGTTLFKEFIEDNGYGRPIGAAFVESEWHILSSFDQTIDSSVFLHKLSTSGVVTPPQGVFAEVGLSPIGSFGTGSEAGAEAYAPAFAGAGEWLFIRNEKINTTVYHLLGKRVTFAGVDKDPIPFQIDTATQGILRHGVAAQSGNIFMVAWLDGRRSTTQPDDARNIVGALVDATVAGDPGVPLVAAITATVAGSGNSDGSISGEKPLLVNFSSLASSGSYDTLSWNFGDNGHSTATEAAHTYKENGIYLAQLTLTKGAYTVHDTVVVTVGTTLNPRKTEIGTPVDNIPGMVTEMFIANVVARLDLAIDRNDVARVVGVVDPGLLPESLTGVLASVSIGDKMTSFNLDAKGAFKSDPSVSPVSRFSINPQTGLFVFEAVDIDLRTALGTQGINETVKPAKLVPVPITVTLDKFAATSMVNASYRATKDVLGTATYGFLGAGDEGSGSFLITKFSASQETQPKTGLKVHSYSIKGRVIQPNGEKFKAGPTGELKFIVGNFGVSIAVGQFKEVRGKLKYVGRVGISGLKKFSIDFNSGEFNLQMLKVPADLAIGGSGMPLANSGGNITEVDLNLSFVFDLAGTANFSAGRYIFIARKNAAGRNWKLR